MRKFTIYNLQFTIKTLLLFFTFYILHFTFYITPVYAEVDIGGRFGFGDITDLGGATSKLVDPVFSIAAFLVILYFLLGAFRYLKAGESKEEVEAARKMITHGIVGFIILMFAFLVLQFLLARLLKIEGVLF